MKLLVDDSQAPLRHRVAAGTVASFRTWRGSRPSLAQDPAISGEQLLKTLHARIFLRALLQYHSPNHATAENQFFSPHSNENVDSAEGKFCGTFERFHTSHSIKRRNHKNRLLAAP